MNHGNLSELGRRAAIWVLGGSFLLVSSFAQAQAIPVLKPAGKGDAQPKAAGTVGKSEPAQGKASAKPAANADTSGASGTGASVGWTDASATTDGKTTAAAKPNGVAPKATEERKDLGGNESKAGVADPSANTDVKISSSDGSLATAAPAPAAPQVAAQPPAPPVPIKTRFPWALFLDIAPHFVASRGYDLFDRNNVATKVGLTAEADFWEPWKNVHLSADLAGAAMSQDDSVLGSLHTRLKTRTLEGGLRLRKDWLPFFATHLGVSLGATQVVTSFNDGPDTKEWVPSTRFGAGASTELSVNSKAILHPGLLFEAGYSLAGSTLLYLKEAAPADGIARSSAQLGSLELSGPYLRFALFARF